MKFPLPTIWKRYVLRAIFPSLCFGCERSLEEDREDLLCLTCKDEVFILDQPILIEEGFLLAAVTNYSPVMKRLMFELKFNCKAGVVEIFKPLIKEYLEKIKIFSNDSLVVPVPLHPRRLRRRGFNQSLLIAEQLALLLGFKVEASALIRSRYTIAQSSLKDSSLRAENVRGCFQVKDPDIFLNKNIVLVDDVFTTGATLKEATLALKKAGAKRVVGFMMARA